MDKNIKNLYIKVKTFEKENLLYMQITDNDRGIPLDIIDKNFNPYFSSKYEKMG